MSLCILCHHASAAQNVITRRNHRALQNHNSLQCYHRRHKISKRRPRMKLDLLAIAAHPDDVELTCGGTLLKMAHSGYKTGILDLTAGEMGTRGTPETRAKEAAKAAKLLRVTWRGTLGVPDSDVQPSRQHKLRLASVIRELRPKTVILPYWEARHPDHYHASALGYEGCFLAGLKQLPMEGEPHRPFKILYSTSYADIRPTFVVDITKEFEQRRKAILAFGSQFRPPKGQSSREFNKTNV